MSYYAVITDEDFNNASLVRIIASGPDMASLRNTVDFNPYGTYSTVLKSSIAIRQIEKRPLNSTFNNQPINAHICECIAHKE